MRVPRDSKKSAWALQIFSTTWYVVFAVVSYCYLGATVQSPSFLSLSGTWAKVSWGLALPNLLVAGALYNHFAAKIVFVRMFRESRHLTENTMMGWGVWILLLAIANGCGFVLATGVPVYSLFLNLLQCYADKEKVLLILGRYCRVRFCVLVYLWPCRCVLVARHTPPWRWLEICKEEVADVLALLWHSDLWWIHLCWWTLCDYQVVDRSLRFWCCGTSFYLLIILILNIQISIPSHMQIISYHNMSILVSKQRSFRIAGTMLFRRNL